MRDSPTASCFSRRWFAARNHHDDEAARDEREEDEEDQPEEVAERQLAADHGLRGIGGIDVALEPVAGRIAGDDGLDSRRCCRCREGSCSGFPCTADRRRGSGTECPDETCRRHGRRGSRARRRPPPATSATGSRGRSARTTETSRRPIPTRQNSPRKGTTAAFAQPRFRRPAAFLEIDWTMSQLSERAGKRPQVTIGASGASDPEDHRRPRHGDGIAPDRRHQRSGIRGFRGPGRPGGADGEPPRGVEAAGGRRRHANHLHQRQLRTVALGLSQDGRARRRAAAYAR